MGGDGADSVVAKQDRLVRAIIWGHPQRGPSVVGHITPEATKTWTWAVRASRMGVRPVVFGHGVIVAQEGRIAAVRWGVGSGRAAQMPFSIHTSIAL